MLIPMRDLIALAGVAVFMAATITVAIVLIIRKAYRDGYEAGKKSAHEISAPGRHPVYLR